MAAGDRTDMGAGAASMRRWMLVVGAFYLILGIRLLPWINGPMIEAAGVESAYTGGDVEPGTPGFNFLLDWMATFGLSLLPLGGILLVAARNPLPNRLLVHLVIWHEVIVGILDDLWFISRDYIVDGFYIAFIVVHAIVIATGIRVLRRAPAIAEAVTDRPATALEEVRPA